MERNKKLLILLISITLYVFFSSDLDEQINSYKEEIKFLNMKIQKEESIKAKKNAILQKIDNVIKVAENNEKFLFKGENNSQIQSEIQTFLKNIAQKADANFLGASWDEPLIYDTYIELPVSASVKSSPPIIATFFYKIYTGDKLINLKNLEIGKTRPLSLLFSFKASGYRIKGKEEEKKNE